MKHAALHRAIVSNAFKVTTAALALASAAAFAPAPAFAEMKPRVLVPPPVTVPAPQISGNWRLDGLLYDRFRLAVRLDPYGGGRYDAKVGWWDTCSGRLSWNHMSGDKVSLRLTASRCSGSAGTWSADRMVCQVNGGYQPAKYEPKVLVPPPGYGNTLSCTYLPGSAYYSPTWVSLKRS